MKSIVSIAKLAIIAFFAAVSFQATLRAIEVATMTDDMKSIYAAERAKADAALGVLSLADAIARDEKATDVFRANSAEQDRIDQEAEDAAAGVFEAKNTTSFTASDVAAVMMSPKTTSANASLEAECRAKFKAASPYGGRLGRWIVSDNVLMIAGATRENAFGASREGRGGCIIERGQIVEVFFR